MKKIVAFFAICSLLLASGCIVNKKVEGYSQQRIVMPPNGEEIIIPSQINTYAVLNQSIAETLVDLGFEDEIVAIDEESLYLGDFKQLKAVFDVSNPDIIELVSAKPEIIIIDTETFMKLSEDDKYNLSTSGIPLIKLDNPKNIEDVKQELEFLVDLTDAEFGDKMLSDFNEKVAKMEQKQQIIGSDVSAFIQISETKDGVTTIGEDAFFSEALEEAGIDNVFSDKTGTIITNKEEVAKRNPEVFIIITKDENIGSNIIANPVYKNVSAVEEGNVIIIKKHEVMNPNYKIVDRILTLQDKIYS